MPQKMAVEFDSEQSIADEQVDHVVSLIQTLAESDGGISRLWVEIESDAIVSTSIPGGQLSQAGESGEVSEEQVVEEPESEETESADEPALNPDTRRWTLASLLYNADESLTVGEIVELGSDTDWEMDQSGGSAELYNMFQDGLVDRTGSPYQYELTDRGQDLLIERSRGEGAAIEPNPFE